MIDARLNLQNRFKDLWADPLFKKLFPFFVISLFLVGSCKTADLPGAYGSSAGPAQFRTALFPDSLRKGGHDYRPAGGYINTAENYLSSNPDALLNLRNVEVEYVLGAPTVARDEPPAEIWQYKTAKCVLDIYFYEPVDDAERLVSHYELRASKAEHRLRKRDRRSCISGIISQKA